MDERRPDDPRHTLITLRRTLISEGWNDRAIARMVSAGRWAKPRRGAYVDARDWGAADDVGRHEITARAVLAQANTELVLSHVSGGAVWDVPLWDTDLSIVDATRRDGRAGRQEAGIRQHRGLLLEEDVVTRHDVDVVSATRLALELSMVLDLEHALSYANDLLHRGTTTLECLDERYQAMQHWPHSLNTDLMLRLADPRIESVGESRTFFVCWRYRLPIPIPQFEMHGADGRLLARVDFAWPEHKVYLEFDGKVKYTRLLKEGESITDVVLREKRREEQIFELTGWRCIRVTWADLYHPELLAHRIRCVLFPASHVA